MPRQGRMRRMDWQISEDTVPSALVTEQDARSMVGRPPATGAWREGDPVGERRFETFGELVTESGRALPSFRIAYETWGELNPARDNAVLIAHAFTGDSHVAGPAVGHPEEPEQLGVRANAAGLHVLTDPLERRELGHESPRRLRAGHLAGGDGSSLDVVTPAREGAEQAGHGRDENRRAAELVGEPTGVDRAGATVGEEREVAGVAALLRRD